MAFQRLPKLTKRVGDHPATITIGTSGHQQGRSRQVYLSVSAKARAMLGDPAAIALEWDPDEWLLRLVAAPADAADAYVMGKSTRVGITPIARELGWVWESPVTVEVRPHGRTAVVADLSQVTTKGVTPLSRQAA